jgi:hypothetical protein
MTTRNFRVNNGISVGDVVIDAATNKITGLSTAEPSADGDVVVKGYLDTRISALSSTSITSSTTNVTVAATTATVTVEGTTALTATSAGVRIHGDLTVDGDSVTINTTTLSVEDAIIECNRNVSSNANMPTYAGLKINRGEGSGATEGDLFFVWDESFSEDGSTYGTTNAGGSFTAGRGANDGPDELVDIRCRIIRAVATSAQYADIAERFAADAVMTPGAVVMFGGAQEITETAEELSEKVFGVVSTQPAYMMNSGAGNNDSHPFVAMTGRTPVRVIGTVNKGDRLVSSSVKGTARAAKTGESINPFHVIGRALESKSDAGIGLVNCFVQAKN